MQRFRQLRYSWLYLTRPRWDTGISPPELIAIINQHPPGKALDLGCGTGTNAITLARKGWSVTGVDFIGSAIRRAKDKSQRAQVGIKYFVQDVTRIDNLPAPFDLVLDMGCLHSLNTQQFERYVDNLSKLLAVNGNFLLYGLLREPSESKPGLFQNDIESLSKILELIWRKDGIDRPGLRSAWFCYKTF